MVKASREKGRTNDRWTSDEATALAESLETRKRNGNETGNGRKRGQ